ncbi:unnamed protein product [Paramecium octaurelia]|uniref:Uncharacterized protein n=1 Tax=Paramecium octaurelia TaxID=43137 RepID=A0A8S1YLF3_PAROT|nr:unnamed protein product [Paramecium octaurelia]
MNNEKDQDEDLYSGLALSKEVDEAVFPILITILKREKIQYCQEFSQDLNQWAIENITKRQKIYHCIIKNRCSMLKKKRRILREQQMFSTKLKLMNLTQRITLQMNTKKLKKISSQKYHGIRRLQNYQNFYSPYSL